MTNRSVQIVSWIFVIASSVLIVQGLADALPKHGMDASWPDHARFHATTGAAFQVGCGLLAILIARVPFLRLERWSWYALVIFALSFAALIPATIWQGSGPRGGAWYVIGALLASMFISLAMTWRTFNKVRLG